MNRHELIRKLEGAGCTLLRHGGKHDIYHNPETGASEPIPRHRDVSERLAKKIIKGLTES